MRLAATPYRNNLCLKGGALLYALEREKSRPTLDFLASKIRLDKAHFTGVFREEVLEPIFSEIGKTE